MIYLDTNIPGSANGIMCSDRLAWLESELGTVGQENVFLFMHHPPLNIIHKAMDKIGFLNSGELAEVLEPYKELCPKVGDGHFQATF